MSKKLKNIQKLRLIKTALNNLGEMERGTIEGKFSYHYVSFVGSIPTLAKLTSDSLPGVDAHSE